MVYLPTTRSQRRAEPSHFIQGEDERIAYVITTTHWCTNPINPAVAVYEIAEDGTRTNVSAAVLSGVPSVVGDDITTPLIENLEPDKVYRVEVLFECGGNTLEAFFFIFGEH